MPRRAAGRRCGRRRGASSSARRDAGTTATATPSSSHRRTSRRSTSFGAVENVMITCSTSCSRTTCSRSQLAPRTGSSTPRRRRPSGPCRGSRSASGRPRACRAVASPRGGRRGRRRRSASGAGPSPAMRARRCDQLSATRPAATYDRGEEPEPERLVDLARGAADHGREREQQDRREPGRARDATEVVGRAEPEARAVEPTRRQQDGDQGAIGDRPAHRDVRRRLPRRRRRRSQPPSARA